MSTGANGLSNLDANQVIRKSARISSPDGNLGTGAIILNSLVPSEYDQISVTYVTSGNGVGEIETAVYRLDGTIVATLTLSYDASNRLIDVIRS